MCDEDVKGQDHHAEHVERSTTSHFALIHLIAKCSCTSNLSMLLTVRRLFKNQGIRDFLEHWRKLQDTTFKYTTSTETAGQRSTSPAQRRTGRSQLRSVSIEPGKSGSRTYAILFSERKNGFYCKVYTL